MIKVNRNVVRWVGLLVCVASLTQAAPFAQTVQF